MIINNLLFFQRPQTLLSLPHERFSSRSKMITKTCVCIRRIKKKKSSCIGKILKHSLKKKAVSFYSAK